MRKIFVLLLLPIVLLGLKYQEGVSSTLSYTIIDSLTVNTWIDADSINTDHLVVNTSMASTCAFDQTITTTTAGGETGHYSYITHTTNALTGELIGIRGNARVSTIDSPSGSVIGGKFQAGNMTVGTDLSAARGVYVDVVNKIPSGATTWDYARGYEVSMDLDQGSAGNVTTFGETQGLYICYNLPTAGSYTTVTDGYGVKIRNEAVGGTGQMIDAALYVDDRNHSGGILGWDYGIDFSGIGSNSGSFGTADIKLANGTTIDNDDADTVAITEANINLAGKVHSGSFGSPLDVGSSRKYGYELHYSGDNQNVTGARIRSQLVTTDAPTRTSQGAEIQASNNDGIDASVINGAVIEAIGKSSTTGARIGTMRGLLVGSEYSANDTITDLRTLHVRGHSRDASGDGCFDGSGYAVYIENEAVGGNGQAYDAGIYLKGTNISGGNFAFDYGLDFSGATINTADFKMANGALLDNPHADSVSIDEANIQLNGIVVLLNGGLLTNPHADTVKITEAVTEITGKMLAGTFGSPTDVGSARKYGYELHYSGDNQNVTVLRARAQLVTTDAGTKTATGAEIQAANNDGVDAYVLNGATIEAIGKSTTTGARIDYMRGLIVGTEWSANDTIDILRTLDVRTHTRDATGDGSVDGSGYAIHIENEAVGGNGQALTAGIYFKGTNISGGNKAFYDGINFSGATYDRAEIVFKETVSGEATIFATGSATDDAGIVSDVGADSGIADGSLYLSVTDGGGVLFIKKNDVWTAFTNP